MKKFGKLFVAVLSAGMIASTVAACSNSKPEITLWVGEESVEFYERVTKEYEKANNFAYRVRVVASDAGSVAGSMIGDNTACGDIITVAHDNIGKLAQKQLIRGINDTELLAQIENDNPEAYKDVIKSKYGKSEEKYTFGVPYISQALFLMYNKRYINETQAQTFEGIKEALDAANAANPNLHASGITLKGTDGFNFSFTLLARNNETKETSLELYRDLSKTNAYAQGDDTVANLRWANQAVKDGTLVFPNSSGFATMMNTGSALGVIGGAWMYKAAADAVGGADNLGLAMIPTWTLTEEQVAGTSIEAGTVIRGGTFADCKCFIINGAIANAKYEPIQELLKYISSIDVQKQSYVECKNVPAFKGSDQYIESVKDEVDTNTYALGKLQGAMAEYGIAQPFVTATLNNYYYGMGADGIYKSAIEKDGITEREIREALWNMEYIWKWGDITGTTIPEVLPGSTDKQSV